MVAVFALSSCLFNNSGTDEDLWDDGVWPVPTGSIQNIDLHHAKITFDVSVGVPSSGWELTSQIINSLH